VQQPLPGANHRARSTSYDHGNAAGRRASAQKVRCRNQRNGLSVRMGGGNRPANVSVGGKMQPFHKFRISEG